MVAMPHLSAIVWDFEDQLQHVNLDGGGNAYYTYDAGGERVRKVHQHNGALVEERIYLGGYEVYRRQDVGGLELERETLHVMDGEQRIALVETKTHDEGAPVSAPAPLTRYQLGNHLDSASLELDGDGAIISYEEYHPYGTTAYQAVRSGVEVSLKRYRYTGKERDEETGLYYHGARYYAPWLGRWASVDPAASSDLSPWQGPYAYADNNPLVNTDPDGRKPRRPKTRVSRRELQRLGWRTWAQYAQKRFHRLRRSTGSLSMRSRWRLAKQWRAHAEADQKKCVQERKRLYQKVTAKYGVGELKLVQDRYHDYCFYCVTLSTGILQILTGRPRRAFRGSNYKEIVRTLRSRRATGRSLRVTYHHIFKIYNPNLGWSTISGSIASRLAHKWELTGDYNKARGSITKFLKKHRTGYAIYVNIADYHTFALTYRQGKWYLWETAGKTPLPVDVEKYFREKVKGYHKRQYSGKEKRLVNPTLVFTPIRVRRP
jgi:RHS repeat-associated protein